MAPLVLWALHRGAPDPHFLAMAAVSLARLTHLEPQPIADACAQALLLQAALTTGADGLTAAARECQGLVQRSAGVPPSPALRGVVDAVARQGGDVAAARRAAEAASADPALAGMLSGALLGASEQQSDPDLVTAVRGLLAPGQAG
jgi:hypothetical protein